MWKGSKGEAWAEGDGCVLPQNRCVQSNPIAQSKLQLAQV